MKFDFLNSVTIAQVEEQKSVKNNSRKAMEKNPTNGASMRLFKDGSIYPSQEFTDTFNLEYNKEKTGNGLDIFLASSWNQYPKDAQNVLFVNTTLKSNSRVDLFGTAREVDGKLTSVMDQGSKTFGNQLIEMIEDVYDTKLFTNSKYVDLVVVTDSKVDVELAFIPKPVMKGEHKGTMTTERRENVTLMPLAIFSNNEGSEIINGEVEEPELVGEEEVA